MKKSRFKYLLLLADLVAIPAAFRSAYFLRYEAGLFPSQPLQPPFSFYGLAILISLGAWTAIFLSYRMGRFTAPEDVALEASRLLTAGALLVGSLLATMYIARTYYSRILLFLLSALVLCFLVFNRVAYQILLGWLRKGGIALRRVVIVGDSELAREVADRLRRHRELFYEVVGFLYPTSNRAAAEGKGTLLSGSEEMARELAGRKVEELVFTLPIHRDTAILDFIASCQKYGIQVKLIPEYYELHANQIESFSLDGIPFLELRQTSLDSAYRLMKALMDYSGALILLLLLFPFFFAISVVLAIACEGRVLKREMRVGREGRPFVMYRFEASLGEPHDAAGDRGWKARFCRFLLRYSLSELPQLWNVLKGDMSLVGPRPETPERVRHYSAWHRRRLQLKPGITGLAQVRGLRGIDSSDRKTKYDLEYVATFSPLLDLTLLMATLNTLLRRGKLHTAGTGLTPGNPPGGPADAKVSSTRF